MDIWEANLDAAAYTPHPCKNAQQTRCESAEDCGSGDSRYAGQCDKGECRHSFHPDGAGWNGRDKD